MGKYRIRIKVELVECNDSNEHDVKKEDTGCFTMTISEKDAISIDNCEKAVLMTAYPSIRDALSEHLAEVSKKKPLKKRKPEK
jgi:hypothetical protein